MADTGQTTELQAVNEILEAINEAPVNMLGSSATLTAKQAENVLSRESKDIQAEGWEFNIEENVALNLFNGELHVPGNAAWVHVPGKHWLTFRGGKVYNKRDKTFAFTESMKATVCYVLDFGELPEVAKRYITARSARKLADMVRPNPQRHAAMLRDELLAKGTLMEQEGIQTELTIFDNFDAYTALDREVY